ncbi:MAG TPA: phosphoribosylglycinamide formyltransferase [Polyangiaceae bacterium]|nr:phosphoribosylglycinamide formyltransferase [Polyangiaceae bacterium]
MATLELGVLVSGNGSNLQAILDAVQSKQLDARIRLVVSNREQAYALERARGAGVPAVVCSHRGMASREAYDEKLVSLLRDAGVEYVVLAGFMRILSPVFVRAFHGRVLNIHPALLPSFPGVNALGQALAHGVKVTGVTVHWVDDGVDTGPIIAQRAVAILPGDDEASLAARVHAVEHELYVEVLRDLAEGKVLPPSPAKEG